jgi:hypothetical protein
MIKKESDLCLNQFERTEAGFDKKNEILVRLKESMLDVSRPTKELVKSAIALGFVAALGVGCSTAEEDTFSAGVDCPDSSSLDVRDTDIQGVAKLVCFSNNLNAEGNVEKYSPLSVVRIKDFSNDEILDEYDYKLDFDVSYTHQPGREFLNIFTMSYDHQPDPVFENIKLSEVEDGEGVYLDVGRHGISQITVTEIGQE